MRDFDPTDFEILYPGVLMEREREVVERYLATNRALLERALIDPVAVAAGTLASDTPGLLASVPVTEDMVRYNNFKYDPENRLLHDADHARAFGYRDILAMPCFGAHDDTFMVPYPAEARDTLLVSQLNHSVNCYCPIYPGDTLHMVANRRTVTDLTPTEGSIYRSVVLRTEGSVYNQRGEKVNDCVWRVMESMRMFKPGRRPADFSAADVWEAPEWIKRPSHYYTDEDDNIYCSDCWHERFVQCEWCDEWIPRDEAIYAEDTGDPYCQHCADRHLYECGDCGNYYTYDLTEVEGMEGDGVCESCLEHGDYTCCDHCDTWIRSEDAVEVQGDYWCHDCATQEAFECEECGAMHFKTQHYYDQETGKHLCRECYEDAQANKEELVTA